VGKPSLSDLFHTLGERGYVARFRITLDGWLAESNGDDRLTTPHPTAWVAPSEFARYPFSTTGRQFAETLRCELREPNLFRARS
jgi:hypothetical protein